MDRDEAIRLLQGGPAGVREWNQRQEREPDEAFPDLRDADLRGADLRGARLRGIAGLDRGPLPFLRGLFPFYRPPFVLDETTVLHGLNFTLVTSLGDLDLLGEIVGGGGYAALAPHSIELSVFGARCLCLGLEKLIEVKRAAGRPKDYDAVAELEEILEGQRET